MRDRPWAFWAAYEFPRHSQKTQIHGEGISFSAFINTFVIEYALGASDPFLGAGDMLLTELGKEEDRLNR